jgi:hypothetical protein
MLFILQQVLLSYFLTGLILVRSVILSFPTLLRPYFSITEATFLILFDFALFVNLRLLSLFDFDLSALQKFPASLAPDHEQAVREHKSNWKQWLLDSLFLERHILKFQGFAFSFEWHYALVNGFIAH